MDIIPDHFGIELVDGKHPANDGLQIQKIFNKRKYTCIDPFDRGNRISSNITVVSGTCCFSLIHHYIFGFQNQKHMTYSVQVTIMPLKELLDPQGKAVMGGLENLGLTGVQEVRIGKNITLQVEAATPEQAKFIAEEASKKLLANPVMEYFEVSVN